MLAALGCWLQSGTSTIDVVEHRLPSALSPNDVWLHGAKQKVKKSQTPVQYSAVMAHIEITLTSFRPPFDSSSETKDAFL